MIHIWVTEEYGYREWLWTFPGTVEEALSEWKAGRRPVDFWGARGIGFKGTVRPLDFVIDPSRGPKRRGLVPHTVAEDGTLTPIHGVEDATMFDAEAHAHEPDDTYIRVGDVTYYDVPPTKSTGW